MWWVSLILKCVLYLLFTKNKRYSWLVNYGYSLIYRKYPTDTLVNTATKLLYLLELSKSISKYDRSVARKTKVKFNFGNAYVLIGEVNRLNRELKKQVKNGGGVIYLNSGVGFIGLLEDWFIDNMDTTIILPTFNDNLTTQLNSLISKLQSSDIDLRVVEQISVLLKDDLTEYLKIINAFSYKI